jgi:hypothetical protein
MHNQKEENPITRPRETERLNGELEIDYQRNTVKFHPNALCEFTFSLPLTPLEVDVVRSLTQISRRLQTHSFRIYSGNQVSAREDKSNN